MRIPMANSPLPMQSILEVVEATLTRRLGELIPELGQTVADSSTHALQALRGPLMEQLQLQLQKQLQAVENMAKMSEMKLFEVKTELLASSNVTNETMSHKMLTMANSLTSDLKVMKEQMVFQLEGITREIASSPPSVSTTPLSRVNSHTSVVSRGTSRLGSESTESPMTGGVSSLDPTKSYVLEEFLEVIGLSRYLTTLRSQDINVTMLVTLSEKQLKDLGVDSLGARLRFMKAFEAYTNC